MTTPFRNVPVGAVFEYRGARYQKLALSLARDENRWGNIFHDETPVVMGAALPSTDLRFGVEIEQPRRGTGP